MKILFIEEKESFGGAVLRRLKMEKHDVDYAGNLYNGTRFLSAKGNEYDMVILDLGFFNGRLPDFGAYKELRRGRMVIPVDVRDGVEPGLEVQPPDDQSTRHFLMIAMKEPKNLFGIIGEFFSEFLII